MNRKLLSLLFLILTILCVSDSVFCQTANSSFITSSQPKFEAEKKTLIDDLKKETDPTKRKTLFDGRKSLLVPVGILLAKQPEGATKTLSDFSAAIEEARVDKQNGGTDTNAGSTNLVSKGSVPAVLGFAVENGAITKDQSGTTITFRGNPIGIVEALRKKGYIDSYNDQSSSAKFFRGLSFAVSFDSNRGTMPGTFTGDKQQLSSYSFRYNIFNRRDPRNKFYKDEWNKLVENQGNIIVGSLGNLAKDLTNNPNSPLAKWEQSAVEAIQKASADEMENVVNAEFAKLANTELTPAQKQQIETFGKAFDSFLSDRDKILDYASHAPIVAFEYTNIRRVSLPDLSNFKGIFETGLFKGKASLTANGSFTIFNSMPRNDNQRVRDFQLAAQFDIPLNIEIQKTGNFILSISGMYKRRLKNAAMVEDDMMNVSLKNRGFDNAIGQVKLTVPVKGSGVKIPLSVTFANRTDLIKEKEVKGNIGITFDLDYIFTKFKN